MTDGHGMRKLEFAADFARAQAFGEAVKHCPLLICEVRAQKGHNFARANARENRIARVTPVSRAVKIFGKLPNWQLVSPAFRGIDAAAKFKVMLEMKSAALQIPASGLAWAACLGEPQMDGGFLEQIFPQSRIGCESSDHVDQRLAH